MGVDTFGEVGFACKPCAPAETAEETRALTAISFTDCVCAMPSCDAERAAAACIARIAPADRAVSEMASASLIGDARSPPAASFLNWSVINTRSPPGGASLFSTGSVADDCFITGTTCAAGSPSPNLTAGDCASSLGDCTNSSSASGVAASLRPRPARLACSEARRSRETWRRLSVSSCSWRVWRCSRRDMRGLRTARGARATSAPLLPSPLPSPPSPPSPLPSPLPPPEPGTALPIATL